jgi:hypothetical protein
MQENYLSNFILNYSYQNPEINTCIAFIYAQAGKKWKHVQIFNLQENQASNPISTSKHNKAIHWFIDIRFKGEIFKFAHLGVAAEIRTETGFWFFSYSEFWFAFWILGSLYSWTDKYNCF